MIATTKNFFTKNKNFFVFLAFTSFIYGIAIVSFNYTHFPISGFLGLLLVILHWLLITIACSVYIYLLALNRWIFLIFFPLFSLITGIFAYYVNQFDITLNTAVIESLINASSEEVDGQVSFKLIFYIIIVTGIALALAYYRFKKVKIQFTLFHLLIIIIGILAIIKINEIRYNTIYQRNPFSIYLGFRDFFNENKEMKKERVSISGNAKCTVDSITVVVVIGEALRADHVSLNGYQRETFPLMKKEKPVSFDHIYSEWTHTLQSLPHILTRSDSINHKPAKEEHSFISIFKACGFCTWWLGNQDLNKVFLPLVKECDSIVINQEYRSDYNFTGKYDGELLPYLSKALSAKCPKKLIIIHLVGCHWWYPSHYPKAFEKFTPVIQGKTFDMSQKQLVINAYDNCALYTDFILSKIVEAIRNDNSMMIFMSDHGELLGEGGRWLHAQNTRFEKNPACMVWFSEKYATMFPQKVQAAIYNKNRRFRTDMFFHSVLDAGEISSPYKKNDLNIFAR